MFPDYILTFLLIYFHFQKTSNKYWFHIGPKDKEVWKTEKVKWFPLVSINNSVDWIKKYIY